MLVKLHGFRALNPATNASHHILFDMRQLRSTRVASGSAPFSDCKLCKGSFKLRASTPCKNTITYSANHALRRVKKVLDFSRVDARRRASKRAV
jgi:hypothetical protein